MTEKRFKLDSEIGVIDTQKCGGDTMTLFEVVVELNKLNEENEQLRKDATMLVYSNQDYRHENENLKKQLDYIQNSISNAIKHQKTELGVKALQEIIADYNEWMLGHKEAKK